jgi:hypothetical protein
VKITGRLFCSRSAVLLPKGSHHMKSKRIPTLSFEKFVHLFERSTEQVILMIFFGELLTFFLGISHSHDWTLSILTELNLQCNKKCHYRIHKKWHLLIIYYGLSVLLNQKKRIGRSKFFACTKMNTNDRNRATNVYMSIKIIMLKMTRCWFILLLYFANCCSPAWAYSWCSVHTEDKIDTTTKMILRDTTQTLT